MKERIRFLPIPSNTEEIGRKVVDSAYRVHESLGPGLLESVYETCFCHELSKRNISYQRQVQFPIIYDGLRLDSGLRLDVLIENEVICELKAAEIMPQVYQAPLLSYLRLSGKRLGYLINFNVPTIKTGIKRIVL